MDKIRLSFFPAHAIDEHCEIPAGVIFTGKGLRCGDFLSRQVSEQEIRRLADILARKLTQHLKQEDEYF